MRLVVVWKDCVFTATRIEAGFRGELFLEANFRGELIFRGELFRGELFRGELFRFRGELEANYYLEANSKWTYDPANCVL
jgi:hypothetical protein